MDAVRGGAAELRGEEARHLTRVLRVEAGQRYEISDNESVWLAEIADARGDHVVFRILEPLEPPPALLRITLCAALVKFDRFEWIIEKATELGVERILPVHTMRVEKGLFEASQKRTERWRRIARESSQQSRRVRMPEILAAVPFAQALKQTGDYRFFLEESVALPLLEKVPADHAAGQTAAMLLGPEGGWTDTERVHAAAAGWEAVSLSPNILRSETAAIAAIAILMNAWMT